MAQTTEKPEIAALRERFEAHGQGHVFRFWERLDPAGRERLAAQAASMDLPALIRGFEATRSPTALPPKLDPPEMQALPEHGGDAADRAAARREGEALLAEGRVAMLVVAGGQASRLGFPGPKGLFPFGPVSERCLFEVQAQKLRRLRERTGVAIPWYIMTSPATDAATREAFQAADAYGVPSEDVFFFCQGMVPSFDMQGKLILEAPDRIFQNPDGHGGSLIALRASGALDDMADRGIETIFYYQVDNPLVEMGDPVLLGYHRRAGAQVSCAAVRKRRPEEKVGVLALVDGRMGVVEYTEIDAEHREARDDRGELRFGAGNVAVHAFQVDFVRRVAGSAETLLPFHASAKQIPSVDAEGRTRTPEDPNGYKLERFVFDVLPAAETVAVVEVSRDSYSPVKNASGTDSPETSRRDTSAVYRRWIAEAGLTPPPEDSWIEIDESQVGGPDDLRALSVDRTEDLPDCIQTRSGGKPT